MTIPNIITILRLLAVPLLIVVIGQGRWNLAFAIFLLAGISDAVDGFIARRYDMRTEFGAYIDPLADKALLVSIYVTLAITGILPGWLAVLVVSRDAMIVAGLIVARLMDRPMPIRPLVVSKANTAAQIAFAATMLGLLAIGHGHTPWIDWGMGIVAALTVASAAGYLIRWLRHMTAS